MRRGVAVVALAGFFMSLGPAASAAQAADPVPALTIVAPEKPTLQVVKASDGRDAKVSVFARPTGNETVSVTFSLLLPGAKVLTADPPEEFKAGAARAVNLLFHGWPKGASPSTVVLQATSAGLPPAVVAVVPQRAVDMFLLWLPILIAFGAAVVAGSIVAVRALHGPRSIEDKVVTEATWKWNDSWATNISAIGAIITLVLASSGFLQEVFPDLAVGRFTGLALLFGGAVIGAPAVYLGFGRALETPAVAANPAAVPPIAASSATVTPVGTVGSLIAATVVTLWGVFGQLALMGVLVDLANASRLEKTFLGLLLVVSAGLVGVYAIRTTGWLAKLAAKDPVVPAKYVGGALI